MRRLVHGAVILVSVAAVASSAPPIAHSSIAPAPMPTAHHHHHPVDVVVAVTGRHHHLFANRLGGHRMRDLGGHLYGAPAVAWAAGQVFFVAATTHGLQVRTERTSWAPLTTRNFACADPELTSHGGNLAVSCLRDNAIWAAVFPATSAGNPHVGALVNQGGTLGTGSAISFYGGRTQVEVIGGDYVVGRSSHYDTYYRALDDPIGQYTQDPLFECRAQPAETSAPGYGTAYLGCVVGHHHHSLRVVGLTPDGEDSLETRGRVQVGRIGLAPIKLGRVATAFTNRHGKTVVETLRYLRKPAHRMVCYDGATGGAAITTGPRGYR